jgi:hypothetical protein
MRSFAHLDAPVTGTTWANQTKDQPGEKPSREWPEGFYVVDDFRIPAPPNTPPVSADLVVGLLTRAGQSIALPDGRERIALGRVAVRDARGPFERLPGAEGGYRLSETIALKGKRAERTSADEVTVTLFWQTDAPPAADYTVFAQVFNEAGEMVGQLDGPACEGSCPTSRWTPGGVIEDTRRIPVRAGAQGDGLRVAVGLYDPATGERLPVVDARGEATPDRAIQIEVAPARER